MAFLAPLCGCIHPRGCCGRRRTVRISSAARIPSVIREEGSDDGAPATSEDSPTSAPSRAWLCGRQFGWLDGVSGVLMVATPAWILWFMIITFHLHRPREDGTTLDEVCWYDDPDNPSVRHRPTAVLPFLPFFLAWGFVGQLVRRVGWSLRRRPMVWQSRPRLCMEAGMQFLRMDNLAWCLFMSFSAILTLRMDRVQGCSPALWGFANFSVFYSLLLLLLLNLQQGNVAYAPRMPPTMVDREERLQPAPPGLLESFPVVRFEESRFGDGCEFPADCSICCDHFSNEMLIVQAPCHVFHVDCLRGWFRFRRSCPLCRKDLAQDFLDDDSQSFSSYGSAIHASAGADADAVISVRPIPPRRREADVVVSDM